MDYPLQGLKVISLAEQYPGPYATLLMADLGAEVWLVERPAGGDPSRQLPPFFSALARNKRSVTLDLKNDEDRDRLVELVKGADVLLEGFRPGTMDKLGLGHTALRGVNPRLVYASISGFGQDGPYRDRPAHDAAFEAIAGLFFKQSKVQLAPPDIAVGDLSAGLFATVGVLAALYARSQTGRGSYVDVSMADGLVSLMTAFLAPLLNGRSPPDFGEAPGYGNFVCADDKAISLSVVHEDHFWRKLCSCLGLHEFADLDNEKRAAASAMLRDRIAAAISKRTRADWARTFEVEDVPWSPVNELRDVIDDPHLRARGLFVRLPAAGNKPEEWHVAQPLKFNGERPLPRSHAPRLGEHNGINEGAGA